MTLTSSAALLNPCPISQHQLNTMTESLTGPGLAGVVLVWSLVLTLSIAMLSAAIWFAVLIWTDMQNHFRR